MAPMYSASVSQYGVAATTGAALIVSFNVMARPLNALIFAAWVSGNPLWIGLTIIIYGFFQILLRTQRPQIWAYLKRMSDKNKPDYTNAAKKTSFKKNDSKQLINKN